MKRFCLCLLISMILSFATICAYADEVLFVEEAPDFYTTAVSCSVELLSDTQSLEEFIVESLTNLETEIDVSSYGIPVSEFSGRYWQILYDNPELFYVSTAYSGSKNGSDVIVVLNPIYTETDMEIIDAKRAEIDEATEEILLLIDDSMTDFDKVMTVHDYMVLHYEYDLTYQSDDIFIMTEKTGTCMGYSLAFNHLMNVLGIDSMLVPSEAMKHAWNLVKIDGEWYHIDLTWDDPTYDKFGQVRHTYALLSSEKFESMENSHYGFDLGDLSASSVLYDKANWHAGVGSVVYCGGKDYWIDGDEVVCEDGTKIFDNLDGGDNIWNVAKYSGFQNSIYAGLAEYDGKLYFNADTGIYCYDPVTDEITLVHKEYGICGVFADKNLLTYTKYDSSAAGRFSVGGTIKLSEAAVGEVFIEDGHNVIRVYKDDSEPMTVFSVTAGGVTSSVVEASGVSKVDLGTDKDMKVFFWDKHLRPLHESKILGE